jgi:hypothetical protein
MKNAVRILAVILVLVSIVSAVGCSSGSDKGSFISMVKMMPEDIGEFTFVDVAVLRADESLASTWDMIQQQLIGPDVYGENISKITGLGLSGSNNSMMLYKGDFDFNQMTSVIEKNSIESYDYKGVKIWTDQNASSTAIIGDVVFTGDSEDVKLCIDVNKGEGSSFYANKDAKDTIGRLPSGYILGVMVTNSSAETYGLSSLGIAYSKQNGNISDTQLLKFNSSDAAEQYITAVGSQIPSGYDVKHDGQYVTITLTSKPTSPNESAYNTVYDEIQNAVVVYATNSSGVFPTINGTVAISGYDFQIIDICSLLTSKGGTLSEVPGGVASVNGSDNDNCDTGCNGCLTSNHYVWAIDSNGSVYSTCVGEDCEANGADGYQGVWP